MEMRRPLVMGILNVTPDSFYAGSRAMSSSDIKRKADSLIAEGADIIDIGACSTRPGSKPAEAAEELERLESAFEVIKGIEKKVLVSVDTFRSDIAEKCLSRWNVDIINDISGGADPEMIETVARHNACYILMHNRGISAEAECSQIYGEDIVADVVSELAFKVNEARKAGICNLIVDPGFGFGKSTEQNFEILKRLQDFRVLECPVLVGVSRKRMTREAAGSDSTESLASTIALNTAAMLKGANIIRVHDVKEGLAAARMADLLNETKV